MIVVGKYNIFTGSDGKGGESGEYFEYPSPGRPWILICKSLRRLVMTRQTY